MGDALIPRDTFTQETPASSGLFRDLFENMQEAYAVHRIITDAAGAPIDYEFIEVNKAFEKNVGKSRGELVGHRASNVFPGLDPFWLQTYSSVAHTGKPTSFERYSKEIRQWVRVYSYSPRPGHFAVLFFDVTREHETLEQLEQAQSKFRALVEQSLVGIYIIDARQRYTYVNTTMTQVFGYSEAEFLALPSVLEVIHPEDRELVREQIRRRLAGETTAARYTHRIVRKSGEVRYIEVHGIARESGGTRSIEGALVDITEQKRAALENERFAAIINSTPDFVGMAALDGRTEFVNSSGRRMLGLNEHDDVSKYTISDMHPAWAYERLRTLGIPAALAQGTWEGESAILHLPTGRELPVSQVIIAHRDATGQVALFATIMRDISERKRVEADFKEKNAELERLNKLMIGRELKMVELKETLQSYQKKS